MRFACCFVLVLCLLPYPRQAEGGEEGRPVVDATGRTLPPRLRVSRLVSLVPSITRQVHLLHKDGLLVGVTVFCDVPSLKDVARVGTIQNPSIEKIVALRPGLVLAGVEANTASSVRKLRKMGICVFVFPPRRCFRDVKRELILLGRILGASAMAEQLAREADDILEKVRESLPPPRDRVRVLLLYGIDPLVGAGGGSFGDEMIRMAGGVNILAGSSLPYPRCSREKVIAASPQVVFLTGMGTDNASFRLRHRVSSLFPSTEAVEKGRIFFLEDKFVCSPDPISFARGVAYMNRCMYGTGNTRKRRNGDGAVGKNVARNKTRR